LHENIVAVRTRRSAVAVIADRTY